MIIKCPSVYFSRNFQNPPSFSLHNSARKKKTVPKIEFTVTFEVLKIYLQDLAYLYFHQFQAVCECFIKIDGIFPNYRHFKVKKGQKQVSEIFLIFKNR